MYYLTYPGIQGRSVQDQNRPSGPGPPKFNKIRASERLVQGDSRLAFHSPLIFTEFQEKVIRFTILLPSYGRVLDLTIG